MTSIITGSGLGLINTSADLLGTGGNPLVGRAGQSDGVYINGATGNVVIRAQDEFVAGLGIDTNLLRTYNSLGLTDGDNNDGWRAGVYRKVYNVQGTLGNAGSTVMKVFQDGAELVYSFVSKVGTVSTYSSFDGSGATDTLVYDSAAAADKKWVWTDGSSRMTESYDWSGTAGNIRSEADKDGNSSRYSYTGSLLTQVVDPSGQTTKLIYTGNNLQRIEVYQPDGTTKQTVVHYTYDGSNRLDTVKVDLSPEDNSITDNKVYTTTYKYDGASKRVASITQGDGTTISFAYYTTAPDIGKLKTCTDGAGKITTLTYTATSVTVPVSAAPTAGLTTVTPGWDAATLIDPNSVILGFEDVNGWSSSMGSLTESSVHDQGTTAVAYNGGGYVRITSSSLSSLGTVGSQLSYRLFVPAAQPNPYWLGQTQLFINAPSLGINDQFIGQVELTNNVQLGAFNTISFTLPNDVRNKLSTLSYSDLQITLSLNVPTDAPGPYILDGLKTGTNQDGASTLGTNPKTEFDSKGNGIAVFDRGADLMVSFYTKVTDSWTTPVAIDGSNSGNPGIPSLSVSANGNAFVSWVQGNNLYGRRYINGAWADASPVLLENVAAAVTTPVGAINDNGTVVVGFVQDGNLMLRTYDGSVWTAAVAVDDLGGANTNAVTSPGIGMDGSGNAIVVWAQKVASNDAGESLYYARYDAIAGSWSTPNSSALENVTTAITAPQIAMDANGDASLAFITNGTLYANFYSLANDTWEGPQSLGAGATGTPSVSINNTGQTLFTWISSNLVVARIWNGVWGAQRTVSNVTGAVYDPIGSINDAGQAAVTFVQNNGTADHVYVNRYVNGAWQSTPTAVEANPVAAPNSQQPWVAIDAMGDIHAMWAQKTASGEAGESVYSARYNNDSGKTYKLTSTPASWAALAGTLYGSSHNNTDAGAALQAALGNIALPTSGKTIIVPTQLDYSASVAGTRLNVVDPLGLTTTYFSDTKGLLRQVLSPTVGGGRLSTSYVYDSNNNVIEVIDGNGNITAFTYDTTNNNLLTRRDAVGNTVAYTYDTSTNQILSETHYLSPDIDGAGAAQATLPVTTRYVYDSESHLRFVISATGRVTESQYNNANGTLAATLQYTDSTYTAAGSSEANLSTWTQGQTSVERTDYDYDFRGNVLKTTVWDKIKLEPDNSTGKPVGDASGGNATVTWFVYDQRGQLLQTVDGRGTGANGTDTSIAYATTYTYDGLGRLRTQSQWIQGGEVRSVLNTVYDDANNKVTTTLANGLATTNVYDKRGLLISTAQADGTKALGTTTYAYDADGRLCITTDPLGYKSYVIYDAAGRVVATVDAMGALTELRYDQDSKVVQTIGYATLLTTAQLALLVSGSVPLNPAVSTLLTTNGTTGSTADASKDRVVRKVYDAANQLVMMITTTDTDATQGYVTQNFYDGAGRLTDTMAYATAIAIPATPTPANITALIRVSGDDRHSRLFYDNAGLVVGSLDAEGYLTENQYNAAAELTHTIRYANAVAGYLRDSGSFAALKGATTAGGVGTNALNDQHEYYFYDTKGQLDASVDAEGYYTKYGYDSAGNQTSVKRFFTPSTTPSTNTAPTTVHPNDDVTVTTYTGANEVKTVTSSLSGTTNYYIYNNVGQLIQSELGWESTGRMDAGDVRYYLTRYDTQGRVIQKLTAKGGDLIATMASPTQTKIDAVWAQNSTLYTYDLDGRMTSATDENGNKTLYYYDADGRLRYTVNSIGEVSETRYNAFGQVSDTLSYTNRIAVQGAWGTQSQLNLDTATSTTNATATSTAFDKYGNGLAVYVQNGTLYGSIYSVATNSWSTAQQLDTAVSGTPSLSVSANGNGLVTYLRNGGANNLAAAVVYSLATGWGIAKKVSPDSTAVYNPVGSINDAGQAVVAFVQSDDTRNNLLTNIWSGTAWGTAKNVDDSVLIGNNDPIATTMVPSVSIDAVGNAVVVWLQKGIGETVNSLCYSRYSVADGTWDVLASSTTFESDTTVAVTAAQIKFDGNGNGVAVFIQNGKLYGSTYSQVGGGSWSAPKQLYAEAVNATPLNLAISSNGNAVVTCLTQVSGINAAIAVVYTPATGWGLGGVISSTANAAVSSPVVSINDAGQVAIAFVKINNLYVSRYTNGAWVAAALVESSANAIDPAMVPGIDISAAGEVTTLWLQKALNTDSGNAVYSNKYAINGGVATAALTTAVNAIANQAVDYHSSFNYTLRGAIKDALETLSASATYTTSSTYNAFGNLIGRDRPVVNVAGASNTSTRSLDAFTYDRRGQLVKSVLDTDNGAYTGIKQTSSTVYDAFGRVTQTTDANGNTRSATYDRLGRTLTSIDPSGTTTMTYDALGRVLTQEDALTNQVATYVYNDTSRQFTMTSAEGVQVTTSMNRHGQSVSVVDGSGNTSTYEYDKDGNLTSTVEGAGSLNLTTTQAYDNADRLISTTNAKGTVTTFQYDAASRVITQTVDPFTDANFKGLNLTSRASYDGQGRVLTTTNAQGVVTQTTYDAKGQVTQIAVDPTGLNLRTTYSYNADGQTISATEAFGTTAAHTVSYVYDNLGRRIEEHVDPAGLNLTTKYSFDANGNVSTRTDELGNVTRYYYDGSNRQTYVLDATGGLMQTEYDANGRVIKQVVYANSLTGGVFPAFPAVPTEADITARLAVALVKDSTRDHVVQYLYDKDGRRTYSVNALGEVSKFVYNGDGTLAVSVEFLSTVSVGDLNTATQDAVRTAVEALTVDMTRDHVSFNVYDAAGRLTRSANGLGEQVRRAYNADGTVAYSVQLVDRISGLNNMTGQTLSSQDFATLTTDMMIAMKTGSLLLDMTRDKVVFNVYDAAGRQTFSINGLGEVSQNIYNADSTLAASVQYASRPSSITDTANMGSTSISASGLRALGNALSTAAASLTVDLTKDHVVFNGYDAVGRQTSSVNNLGEVSEIVYNADGSVAQTIGYGTRPSSITDVITGSALTASELATMSATVGTKVAALPVPNLANNDHLTFNLYDAAGRQTYTINGLGSVSQAIYNADGTVAASVQYMTPMNGISGTTTAEDIAGTLVTTPLTVDVTKDHVVFNGYDAVGRQTSSVNNLGEVSEIVYNADGSVAQTIGYGTRPSSITDVITGSALTASELATMSATVGTKVAALPVPNLANNDHLTFNLYDAAGRQTYTINGLG
ncbi:RHS repeat protein, partial [Polaromonas sp. A23]|uniref:RHS repeat protein n=2 Tax=Polaromonas sp. A23 TaxID=1944133 RepID=UPI0009CEE815